MSNKKPEWLVELEIEEKRRRAKLGLAKIALLGALKSSRIDAVSIAYDGEGDSGQLTDISASTARGKATKLRGSVVLDLDGRPYRYHSLAEALDAFTWAVLQAYHRGFENNEGGYGTLTIDVARGTVMLDHNDRIIEVSNKLTEV